MGRRWGACRLVMIDDVAENFLFFGGEEEG